MNFAKFFGTHFLQNTSGRLHLFGIIIVDVKNKIWTSIKSFISKKARKWGFKRKFKLFRKNIDFQLSQGIKKTLITASCTKNISAGKHVFRSCYVFEVMHGHRVNFERGC